MTDWATPRRLLILVASVLAVAFVIFLLLPSGLPNAKSIRVQETVWALPVPVRVESDLALSAINRRRLWGAGGLPGLALTAAGAPVDEKPLTPADWRIAGVFTEGGQFAVLVTTDGQLAPQTLHVGDQLPGGAKILAISSDRLSLSLAGRRVSLSTYPQ